MLSEVWKQISLRYIALRGAINYKVWINVVTKRVELETDSGDSSTEFGDCARTK